MRSVQNKRFSQTWIDLFIIRWSSYFEVADSIFASSVVVSSIIYKVLDFMLKSQSTTIKCQLDLARVSKVSPNLSINFSKRPLV